MTMSAPLLLELQQESANTRKYLERVPMEQGDWRPHEKSMSLGALATHIAEIYGWLQPTIDYPELDFAKGNYQPTILTDTNQLLEHYESNLQRGITALEKATNEQLREDWTLRNGDQVYFTAPRIGVVRGFVFNHLIHHRGQLGVYLRLLNVPLPNIYGPTADEEMMVMTA